MAENNAYPEFHRLVQRLHAWDQRRRSRELLLWAPRGLLAGLMVAVLLATISRLRPFLTNREVGLAALFLGSAGLLAGGLVAALKRRSLIQQARFADARFHLQERLSTAVEVQEGLLPLSPVLARQQLADTLRAAERVDPSRLLPFRLHTQDWITIALASALLLAATFLPNGQSEIVQGRRAVARAIEEQVTALQAVTEEVRQNPALSPAQQEQLLDPLQSALQELQSGELNQEEAVAVLSETEAELRDLAGNAQAESLRQNLAQASQPLLGNPAGQALGQALQQGDLAAASAAANALADRLGQMDAADQADLAQDLAATAEALRQSDPALAEQLAQAAQALAAGDTAAAEQALRQAAGTLQQRAQEAAAAAQADRAASAVAEGRQEVAQAGSTPPTSPGPSQPGAGQQPGQGAGPEGAQPGGGAGGQGQEGPAPLGPGNEEDAGTAPEGSAGGPGPGGGHVENVFAPPAADLSTAEGVGVELPAECLANPENCGSLLSENPTPLSDETSLVPYSQVFGDYRDAAYEALSSDHIPLGLKEYVRDYFSSLEP